MDALEKDLGRLTKDATLSQSVEDVEKILGQLLQARDAIANDPNSASITLAKLQNPVKQGFDQVNDDLKKVHQGLNKYGKSLDKNLPVKSLPLAKDAIKDKQPQVVKAIAMHLLREGNFEVAQAFLREANEAENQNKSLTGHQGSTTNEVWENEPSALQENFSRMYIILDSLKSFKDAGPASVWAAANSEALESRGSNLEFELTKITFIHIFLGSSEKESSGSSNINLVNALQFARTEFPRFQKRYMKEIQQLSAAIVYGPNLADSPYSLTFDLSTAWADVATSFTRDYCSLLGLSAESPLYLAVTAGAIALPTLLKLATIMKEKRTEWTTQHELPVEIPLPASMTFHAIFVCPVSKEQATEENPPMMMPCGHVVAKESLGRLSKGGRFKCPYCPGESWPRDAKQIYL